MKKGMAFFCYLCSGIKNQRGFNTDDNHTNHTPMTKKIQMLILVVTCCMTSLAQTLDAGDTQLTFVKKSGGYTLRLTGAGSTFVPQDGHAAVVEVFNASTDAATFYSALYDSIDTSSEKSIKAYATVKTAAGSEFLFTDTWFSKETRGTIRLQRVVRVTKAINTDASFNTYFLLGNERQQVVSAYQYLLPALIYIDGSNMTDASIGHDFSDQWILAREERTPLPLTMMRETSSGVTLSLCDDNQNPTTAAVDWGMGHLVDNSFHYGSIGYCLTHTYPLLAYCFPGSEGEHSYSDGGGTADRRWARRSHPVATATWHRYNLEMRASTENDFPSALRSHWQTTFDVYDPKVLTAVRSSNILKYCVQLLDKYWLKSEGAAGFPFSVWTSSGIVNETTFDMGFVGMQTACAYYLYRNGIESNSDIYRIKGEQALDFWARRSPIASGMPRIWYDIAPWNSFRNYNDLRNMQGGMEAMIEAWVMAERYRPGSKPQWLKFCRGAADWMIAQQATDGSMAKAYDNAGNVVDTGKYLTSNVIRFLVQMYTVTLDEKYKTAAVKAGEFCLKEIHTPYKYIGSVIDNPYVKDRESGQKMLEACLALYDVTQEQRWLDAAVQAAYYTVTYMYAWNIPAQPNIKAPWSSDKNTAGITIIATGHSGADCGLAYNSFEYFRLYLLTGDEYLLKIARLLAYNTKQTMNFDGKLSYPHRGLQTEALRLVTNRGDGVNLWLPWVTATALDPLYRFKDAYGNVDLNTLARMSVDELRQLDEQYRRTQGLAF